MQKNRAGRAPSPVMAGGNDRDGPRAELLLDAEELTRFNRVVIGRELRVTELKQEVNELELQPNGEGTDA